MKFKDAISHVIVIASLALTVSVARAETPAVQLVGFGDSLMAGYQLAPNESYTAQLEAALKQRG